MIDVYVETGAARAFAGAIDWPGWCRSGRDEARALQALQDYAARYRTVVGSRARLPQRFELRVVERLRGDATTDFGAPSKAPRADARRMEDAERARVETIVRACWRAFDAAAQAARGAQLSTGPRGGGRTLDKIIAHVLEAEESYLRSLGGRPPGASREVDARVADVREEFLRALDARRRGEIPDKGPRGGARWSPRYAVRRAAWHVLDHAWEIEDRIR